MNKIILGDALAVLKTLPDESVDCIITSPPYYGLRDYGIEGQVGLEKSLGDYLAKMLEITAELKRVLKKTGTLWWNHGDSYSHKQAMGLQGKNGGRKNRRFTVHGIPGRHDVPEKSLMLQAHRLAIRMVDEQGWILRNQIIWHKPNVMPSSVKDRFSVDFEPIFFFTKSQKYFFEKQFEPVKESSLERAKYKLNQTHPSAAGSQGTYEEMGSRFVNKMGRNKRSVWKIATRPFKEAHFATFPETLIETPVKAGCPEFICNKCGEPRKRIFKASGGTIGKGWHDHSNDAKLGMLGRGGIPTSDDYAVEDMGLTDCGCGAAWRRGGILDPFMGAGTTAVVALKLDRNFLGIEINPEYIKIAEDRLKEIQPKLL